MKVGDIFESTSKRMQRQPWGHCKTVKELAHKAGYQGYFVKDNRRYFAEVVAISRTTNGYKRWRDLAMQHAR